MYKWFFQVVWKSVVEYKGTKEFNCKTDFSSRIKSRFSDPTVPCGKVVAQQIKVTLSKFYNNSVKRWVSPKGKAMDCDFIIHGFKSRYPPK